MTLPIRIVAAVAPLAPRWRCPYLPRREVTRSAASTASSARRSALVFEDPNGTASSTTRSLVVGAGDARSARSTSCREPHARRPRGQCAHQGRQRRHLCRPGPSVSALPNSSAANIAIAKKAKIVTAADAALLRRQAQGERRQSRDSILARFGSRVTVGGVRIATVTAIHSNGLDPTTSAATWAGHEGCRRRRRVGLPTGYILRFSPAWCLPRVTPHHRRPGARRAPHYNAKLAVMKSATAASPPAGGSGLRHQRLVKRPR